jgi:hypothetical protein
MSKMTQLMAGDRFYAGARIFLVATRPVFRSALGNTLSLIKQPAYQRLFLWVQIGRGAMFTTYLQVRSKVLLKYF